MWKAIVAALALALLFIGADRAKTQTSEYQTVVLTGTADLIIDSTLTAAAMNGKRIFINSIYLWYDNGANTNSIILDVCRGRVNMATGAVKEFKWTQVMATGGITFSNIPVNLSTGRDSTIYFVVSGTGTDSLFAAFNYRMLN